MKTYAMAAEGSLFCRDGFDLSWPQHGQRDVIEADPETLPESFKLRLHYGVIEEVHGLEVTKHANPVTPYKLYEGEEARQIFEEPAGPVVVQKHTKRIGVDVRQVTLVPSSARGAPSAQSTKKADGPDKVVLATTAHRGG